MVYYMQGWGGAVGVVREYVVIIPRTESFVPEHSPRVLSMRRCASKSNKIKMGWNLAVKALFTSSRHCTTRSSISSVE